jgi:hypothetical protein
MAGVNNNPVRKVVHGREGKRFAVDQVVEEAGLQSMVIPSISSRAEKKLMCGRIH